MFQARLLPLLAIALALAGCGRDGGSASIEKPKLGVKGTDEAAARGLGFPEFATKNTTRVAGADAIATAAAVAQAVLPAGQPRPGAVALADASDWKAALAAAVFMAPPIRAPLLLSDSEDLPPASRAALDVLKPTGAKAAGNAQLVRVGKVARPDGLRTTDVRGRDIFELARAIDAFQSAAKGTTSDRVLIVSADAPAFAMPAAAWAAKSGDPILFVTKDEVPLDTRAAVASHQQPKIYVLGPSRVISPQVTSILRRLGTVTRIGDREPVASAVAFARFVDGPFGWGVVDPGHGLVFANAKRPADAGAASALSSTGTYGPLLLTDDSGAVPGALRDYLLDIQPGYTRDPVRGVYNHGWVVGDDDAISVAMQSQLDALLEIVPVGRRRAGAG
jgi:hypothetical protein